MAEQDRIQNLVERAVAEVLERHVPQIRQELVRQVLEEVGPELQGKVSSEGSPEQGSAAGLLSCISAIHAGTTQKEVLRALLDNSVQYSGRSALFVVRAGAASGWEGRGFNNEIKDFGLDVSGDVVGKAIHAQTGTGTASEVDPNFAAQFGAGDHQAAVVIPLILKDKVAALLYADGGENGRLDVAALEVLVKAAGAWLEVALLRKQTAREGAGPAVDAERTQEVPVQTVTSFSDPFAGHSPAYAAKPEIPAEPARAAAAHATVAVAEAPAPGQMSAEDADVHRKAQRFARLLVDEIKLYNQVKVSEGRQNKDLYERLREDIDKSRSTYQKRYGNTAAASGDYFNSELVRSLAEDDVSIMGASFRR